MMSQLTKIVALIAALVPGQVLAAGGVGLLMADVDLGDSASLQRGAKLFMNYCSGCHGLSFMRYNRMGRDIGISDELLKDNLLFTGEKVEDKITTAMRAGDAAGWFGVAPPDLSVVARSRGPDWLYSYLVTFYADDNPSRPFGVNNLVFPDVGMPHVLWSLQGHQVLQRAERPEHVVAEHPRALEVAGDKLRLHTALEIEDGDHVRHEEVVDLFEVTQPGKMSPAKFRKAAGDITNFLTYVGEPAKLVRYQLGVWVLAFLAVLFFLARALYKEYWRDVH
jgi:ubiquinol-cytochrome c reductase cytochrome c1 subunit